MERCELKIQPNNHIHILKSVRVCEGMSAHISKWFPLWELESLWSPEFLESNLIGQNSLD